MRKVKERKKAVVKNKINSMIEESSNSETSIYYFKIYGYQQKLIVLR